MIKIKNKRSPGTDPRVTPEFIFLQLGIWPFNTTLCSRLLLRLKQSNSLSTQYACNSNKRPLCQTSSKAFEMSRNTPLRSIVGLLSSAVSISCITESSWATHESPGRKPDSKRNRLFL